MGKYLEEKLDAQDDITDAALETVYALQIKVRDESSALKNYVLLDANAEDHSLFQRKKFLVAADLAKLELTFAGSNEFIELRDRHTQFLALADGLNPENASLEIIKQYIRNIDAAEHEMGNILDRLAQDLSRQDQQNDAAVEQLLLRLTIARYSSIIIAVLIVLLQFKMIFSPITTSIKTLESQAKAIGSGQWDQRVKIKTQDEIEGLAHEFNAMASHLEALYHSLEQKVEQRTNTISQTNERLKTALTQLKKAQGQLIQQEKLSSLGQLVAGVAHEINNPVSFIFGNLTHAATYFDELLQILSSYEQHYPQPHPEIIELCTELELDFLKTDLAETLSSMKLGADRIREIVLSLRTFSRIDEAERKAAQIHDGIDSTLMILQSRLRAQFNRPEITVHKHYGEIQPLYCYPGQLNQVFMNLLANAIDALEEHYLAPIHDADRHQSLNIEIWTRILSGAQMNVRLQPPSVTQPNCDTESWLEITIADNGPGIPKSALSKLFDPFFTTKPVGKGTGLGLSISYQIIVEKHGGDLRCESVPGQGTKFIITIPIVKEAVAQEAAIAYI
ncbi:MAG: sensor histidine kinase [Spirulinaceae cyanobacterium]